MISKKPVVSIISRHCYCPSRDIPFELHFYIKQDNETSKIFPFLPFDEKKNIKKIHPVDLNSEERKTSYWDILFYVATLEEAKELEAKVLQEVKGLLEAWMSEISVIMDWESTHMEYDSSTIVDEEANEKIE